MAEKHTEKALLETNICIDEFQMTLEQMSKIKGGAEMAEHLGTVEQWLKNIHN
jgi:hypothetical protein